MAGTAAETLKEMRDIATGSGPYFRPHSLFLMAFPVPNAGTGTNKNTYADLKGFTGMVHPDCIPARQQK